jgi:DNA polymerase III alpha subunit
MEATPHVGDPSRNPDRDGVYGAPRMHMAAQKLGLKAHVGAEVSLEDALFGEAARCRYPLLVETNTGYQNLCRLITNYKLRERSKGEGAATFNELEQHTAGVICLAGGEEGPLAEALIRGGYLRDLGVSPAIELAHIADGTPIRTAGMVIARQRPGPASGFLFLSLEDETGISNAIIRPDLYEQNRLMRWSAA